MALGVHDPHHAALRKAARTAVVMPSMFALCYVVFDNLQMAVLASFGGIAMLAFADFGGPPRRRAGAYVGLTLVGLPLIAIGTLVSSTPWLAALVMGVTAAAITFAGSLGGYYAAGGIAATLAFVLPVAFPGDAGDIPDRMAGWALTGAVATVAALVLWPRFERGRLLRLATSAASSLAGFVGGLARGEQPDAKDAREAATALVDAYRSTPYRPAGPTLHDQAFVYLAGELIRSEEFGEEAAALGAPADPDGRLLGVCGDVFAASAAVMSERAEAIDLGRLERDREAHMDELQLELVRLPGGEAHARVERAFAIRMLSYLALSVGANALLVRGRRVPEGGYEAEPLAPSRGVAGTAERLREITATHLRLDSVWCQAAIRAAVGLGTAVLVALLARIDHGFWVLLGTLSVLKSSAVTTSYTAWQALLGTVAGFGISTAFLAVGGEALPVLWAALPVCVFLAVYTPTAIHAVVGQAMFTLTVVVLFNIIEPEGWRTGLVRVEDIGIGSATALVVGFALWPRGAGGNLRTSLAEAYEAGAAYVLAAARCVLGRVPDEEAATSKTEASEACRRARDSFGTYLNERGPKRIPRHTWGQLLTTAEQVRFAGDALLARVRGYGVLQGPPAVGERLDAEVTALGRQIIDVADALATRNASPRGEPVARVGSAGDRLDPRDTITVVLVDEWVEHARRALGELDEPLHDVNAASERPWWR